MENSPFKDLEGYFEPAKDPGGHLRESEPLDDGIAEQQLRKTYWRLSFKRVQFGEYQGRPACLVVVEIKFAPEDRKRHRFTKAQISLKFEGKEKKDVKVEGFAPEEVRGISVPETHTSNWVIKPKISVNAFPMPVSVDISGGEYGHRKTYQIDRIARMDGSPKGIPVKNQVQWNLNEASQEGIPPAPPSLVVLITYKKATSFNLRFTVNASIGRSLNPQRWAMFAKSLEPISLNEGMQLIPCDNEVDSDFTCLDLQSLTRLTLAEI
ncbi:hypothetical protein ACLMJK_005636 [Lecanora helva]